MRNGANYFISNNVIILDKKIDDTLNWKFFTRKRNKISMTGNVYINALVQNYSISIANALEILQSRTKPTIYTCTTQVLSHLISTKVCTLEFYIAI